MSFLGGLFSGGNVVSVAVRANTDQYNKAMKSARREGEQFSADTQRHLGKTSNFIKGAFAVGAAAAVGQFAQDSIRAFSDLNESTNAVQVTFGDAAEGVLALGENAATSLGLANSEFNQLSVGFSAFVETIAAESDGDVVGTLDKLTTRIADFGSVMNIDIPEAAEKFRSGLAGETEPLRKFGIDVSAAAVKAKALELGLGGASGELTEQEKILARYELIMEQTNKTAGDFANTSDDLANKQRILDARFEDTKAAVGEGLVPAMTGLLEAAEPLVAVLGDLGAAFGGFVSHSEKLKGSDSAFDRFAGRVQGLAQKGALPFLIEAIKAVGEEFGSTEEEIDETAQTMSDTADRVLRGRYVPALEETEEAEMAVSRAVDMARQAIRRKQLAVLGITSPAIDFYRAMRNVADAELAAAEAADTFSENSQEATDAAVDVASASIDLKAAFMELREDGIDPAGAAARTMFEGMGLPDSVVEAIIAKFAEMEAELEARAINMNIQLPDIGRSDSGWVRTGTTRFVGHEGGVIPGLPGQEVNLRALRGETILPTHDPAKMGRTNGVTVIVQGFVGSEMQLAQEIDRMLTRRGRTSGLDMLR